MQLKKKQQVYKSLKIYSRKKSKFSNLGIVCKYTCQQFQRIALSVY